MNNKRKIVLISVVSGAISLALISFIIFYFSKEIKNYSQELLSVRNRLSSISGQTSGVSQIKEIYKEIEPNINKVDQSFVDSGVPIGLIKFFEETAKESNVLINISSSAIKETEEDLWLSIGFRTNLTGSFVNTLRFIDKIESGSYLVEIQDLKIQRLSESELKGIQYSQFSLGDVNVNLSIKVYTK